MGGLKDGQRRRKPSNTDHIAANGTTERQGSTCRDRIGLDPQRFGTLAEGMQESAHFSVDTRLAALLGETYRSTEAALKELVDNAWDADADNVWITLPKPLTEEPIIVRDDGAGMTITEVRREYLTIARDPRSRRGEKSPKYKRRIKGRKGIGKFAGLAAARLMNVVTASGGKHTVLDIDKEQLLAASDDLERVPLPIRVEDAAPEEGGTTISLHQLNQNLSFPHEEPMRSALVHEYGRAQGFTVYVNGMPLTIEDVPGSSHADQRQLPVAGNVSLRFTIAQGYTSPKYPGRQGCRPPDVFRAR